MNEGDDSAILYFVYGHVATGGDSECVKCVS